MSRLYTLTSRRFMFYNAPIAPDACGLLGFDVRDGNFLFVVPQLVLVIAVVQMAGSVMTLGDGQSIVVHILDLDLALDGSSRVFNGADDDHGQGQRPHEEQGRDEVLGEVGGLSRWSSEFSNVPWWSRDQRQTHLDGIHPVADRSTGRLNSLVKTGESGQPPGVIGQRSHDPIWVERASVQVLRGMSSSGSQASPWNAESIK